MSHPKVVRAWLLLVAVSWPICMSAAGGEGELDLAAGFADPPNPRTNPTILDAQGQGRVFFISRHVGSSIEGLQFTGGNATGLGGAPGRYHDAGGGVYTIDVTTFVSNCQVLGNFAPWYGGGLFSLKSSLTLEENTVSDNTVIYRRGGGLSLLDSTATLRGNIISANGAEKGGGLYLYYSAATLNDNTISNNTATGWYGGGVYLLYSDAAIVSNTINSNTADTDGGGLYLYQSDVTLSNNTIFANGAQRGGGLFLEGTRNATLSGNNISGNVSNGPGSGVCLYDSDNVTLRGNTKHVEMVSPLQTSMRAGILSPPRSTIYSYYPLPVSDTSS